MFRKSLLIVSTLILAACGHTKPETLIQYKYIERPRLGITLPEPPAIKNQTEFTLYSDGRVCTSSEEIKSHMTDLVNIKEYIDYLNVYIETYRSYYENQQEKDISESK